MEKYITFEERDQLYGSLIKDLNLQKVEEVYYPHAFGNYYITFSANEFLIRYINDRSQLTISVASNSAPSQWYPLSFIKNFINKAEKINTPDDNQFGLTSIIRLNEFLKRDFDKIAELLSKNNYKNNLDKISALLKQEFIKEHPGVVNG